MNRNLSLDYIRRNKGFARQQAAIRKLAIDKLPAARWRGGSASGTIGLTEILRGLR